MNELMPIAVFGESLVDIVHSKSGASVRSGGSPLNVAVGLARLGADVEFATSVGEDTYGNLVLEHLTAAGVHVTPGSVGDAPTSAAEAIIGADGSASYRFDLQWAPSAKPQRAAIAGHLGSVSAVLQPGATCVVEWAADLSAESLVSFDPNIRPSITGTGQTLRDAVERAVAVSDVVKLSSEDLVLLGEPNLPERWVDGGTTLVVVTDGRRGARVVTRAGHLDVPARAVAVVDTIGAGDSFMAGLLWSLGCDGLLDQAALRQAPLERLAQHARFATDCAAVTVGRVGADPPTSADVADLPKRDQSVPVAS